LVHTDSSLYWSPLKPRINIYGFTDTSYSSPLYTYNAFTDSGTSDRPVSLSFESQTITAGTFSLEIDNSADSLDPDAFLRGNRVVIECSKDGSTWQTAFKGLVRSGKQKIFATNNRTISIEGYSYLIRLTERILSTRKQAALVAGQFDRTDSTMFTDNLLSDIFTNDIHYLNSVDDTQLYSVFKADNIASSPIDDFVPRIDAPLSTLGDTINSVLEFSQSLLTVDFSNDELVLFNPDRLPTTGGAGVFLLTDNLVQSADDANYTMYPLSDYSYQISYDYPDAGNRLIGSIGNVQCPPTVIPGTPGSGGLDTTALFTTTGEFSFWSGQIVYYRRYFTPTSSPIKRIRIPIHVVGTPTGSLRNRFQCNFIEATHSWLSSNFYLYPESQTTGYGDSTLDTPVVTSGTSGPKFVMTSLSSMSLVLPYTGLQHTIAVATDFSIGMDTNNNYRWLYNGAGNWLQYNTAGGVFAAVPPNQLIASGSSGLLNVDMFIGSGTPPVPAGGTSDTLIPGCGGLPESADADPILMISSDANEAKRIGLVEQAVTNMPVYVKNLAAMNEYMFKKLYVTARPRFNFDFPSVTAPGLLPKAGDIVCHVSKKAQVGRARAAMQTGVIASVNYQFAQDADSVLGLRKLAVATTGILRGSY
jgi:hypothetical protein